MGGIARIARDWTRNCRGRCGAGWRDGGGFGAWPGGGISDAVSSDQMDRWINE
jgi:hypothetical protein